MSLKRSISTISKNETDIYISSTIHDRSSSFVAHFSPTIPPRQLQSLPDIKSASHKILAWRRPSTQRTLFATSASTNDDGSNMVLQTGFDDDGEQYAGKKLLKVLDDYKVEGSIVVARWYGGIMLGPVRFTHIETVAKEVLREYLQFKSQRDKADNGETEEIKRIRLEQKELEDREQKKRLVDELKRRDESIVVLRGLLEDKTKKDKPKEGGDDNIEKKERVVREVDYEIMPLERLKAMDKVRDNTIAFLLRKIDEAESESKKGGKIEEEKKDEKG